MILFTVWLSIVACTIQVTENARILGFFPTPGKSHHNLGFTLMKELAERGHDVTFISPFEEKNVAKNLSCRNIALTSLLDTTNDELAQIDFYELGSRGVYSELSLVVRMMGEIINSSLGHPSVQNLIHSGETFDVIIVEQFMTAALQMLGPHFQAPVILFSPVGAFSWMHPLFGNPAPPSYVPDIILGYPQHMTFIQRAINTFLKIIMDLVHHFYVYPSDRQLAENYFPDGPNFYDVLHNASLILLNSHISFGYPHPSVPNMIEIGGFHVKPTGNLTQDLQEFLDDAPEGVIFFSMGSNLRSKDLPESKRNAIIRVFSELKQKVLWKWEDDNLPGKPHNVKTGKWLPQQEILAHQNVKLFITHGGMSSTIETICHGVPILAIPIYGDQKSNARAAANHGIGLVLPYEELDEENFRGTLTELLQNPKYSNTAKRRAEIFHDRPLKPRDEAVYWVEYVIRHKGAHHLMVAGRDLPWYKYFLLDVIASAGAVAVIFLYITIYIMRKIYRNIKCRTDRGTSKIKRN